MIFKGLEVLFDLYKKTYQLYAVRELWCKVFVANKIQTDRLLLQPIAFCYLYHLSKVSGIKYKSFLVLERAT